MGVTFTAAGEASARQTASHHARHEKARRKAIPRRSALGLSISSFERRPEWRYRKDALRVLRGDFGGFGSLWAVFGALVIVALCGCTTSLQPVASGQVSFLQRTQTQWERNVWVTAAVPSADECLQVFGAPLYQRGIQPVWLEIENQAADPVWLLPASLDPGYFSPLEAAYLNHTGSGEANRAMDLRFRDQGFGSYVAPGAVQTGFVFTRLDEGSKSFNVDLLGQDQALRSFTFFIPVPGLHVDHHAVDFDKLYPPEERVEKDQAGLRQALVHLPCCTTNRGGTRQGDPLNLVMVGTYEDLLHTLIRAGWDETEIIYGTSLWKTAHSFLTGSQYRYSPISALYVFGRSQDIALQKAREAIHERNHLRLWMTPMKQEGKPVWIGQISRDIGVRFTRTTITTHKIDPDVDETRGYLLQNLWYSQGLARYGFVDGVVAAPASEPRSNLTGDPYFTDGLRLVVWVSGDPLDMEEVDFVDWKRPPGR